MDISKLANANPWWENRPILASRLGKSRKILSNLIGFRPGQSVLSQRIRINDLIVIAERFTIKLVDLTGFAYASPGNTFLQRAAFQILDKQGRLIKEVVISEGKELSIVEAENLVLGVSGIFTGAFALEASAEVSAFLPTPLAMNEITIITGIRRSGKSTIMYQIVDYLLKTGVDPKQILFVNFEEPALLQDSVEDVYLSYRQSINPDRKAFIFLDEIQKKENWVPWLRARHDQNTEDKFIVSGSSSNLLKKDVSTLLTGRNISVEIFPLSFSEFLDFKGVTTDKSNLRKGLVSETTTNILINDLEEFLTGGGFPRAVSTNPEERQQLLSQYFEDIFYKDIVERHNLNSRKARDLALYLMTNVSSQISLRNLRESLGLSYDAIKDYLSYFREALLFFTIDHFSYSFSERKNRAQKIYSVDNGLRNAVSFKFSKDLGKLAENCVMIELLRRKLDVFYWKGKGEVDFVIKGADGSLTAINVTYTDDLAARELKSLTEFKAVFGDRIKHLILITRNTADTSDGIEFVPLWKWLLSDSLAV